MEIIFTEDRVWEYKDGRIIHYDAGVSDDIEIEEAELMIEAGVASGGGKISQEETSGKEDNNSKFNFYKTFSLSELKSYCRDNDITLKTHLHNTKPKIIEEILKFEKG